MMPENIGKSLKDLREEAIVYVAAELFLRDGIESVKMTDIADRAEVGVASLYRYFGTKEALVLRAGALLWQDLQTLFGSVYEAENFHAQTGLEQIIRLFGVYRKLFREQPDFIRFVGEFDSFVIHNRVEKSQLQEYEKSVLNFYPVFLASYEAGLRDGSVRKIAEPRLYYEAVCHAVMSLSQKLLQGDILPADGFADTVELELLLDMAARYLRRDKEED